MEGKGITYRDQSLNDDLTPTKSKAILPPAARCEITLKGVSIKGTSKVQYEDPSPLRIAGCPKRLSQEKVPVLSGACATIRRSEEVSSETFLALKRYIVTTPKANRCNDVTFSRFNGKQPWH